MSSKFTTSVALSALLAMLAAPVLAQDAAPTPAPTPAPEQSQAQAPAALPQALTDAGMTDVTRKPGPRGSSRVEGALADGSRIEAMLDDENQLRGLRVRGDGALPTELVTQLVPQSVRDNAVYGELGRLTAVFTGDRGVMLAGQDAEQNKIRAAFAEDGTLLRFGRGDDKGPGFGKHGPKHDRKGDHRGGKHWRDHDRDHDRHGKHHRHGRDDDRREGHRHDRARDHDRQGRDMPPPPAGAPQPPAPQQQGALQPQPDQMLDLGAVRSALTAAGYSGIGDIVQDGPRVLAMATNPQGEPVSVELGPRGEVMREINR